VVSADLDGTVVVFHTGSGCYYALDPAGSLVWRFLDGDTTVRELAGDVAIALGVPEPDAERDIVAFVGTMRRRHLVVVDA
jgi:outer membrane protein assembly factor BamB